MALQQLYIGNPKSRAAYSGGQCATESAGGAIRKQHHRELSMILRNSVRVRIHVTTICLILAGFVLAASLSRAASPPPGSEESIKTEALKAGAALLQSNKPVEALGVYLDGFHFQNGHMDHQMEAHHYCAQLSEDFIQCVLYDGTGKDARLIGIEYVVSEKLFKTLSEEEKKMWHSHVFEVKSGMLVAPGLPEAAEHELVSKLISTYGKTWHTWNMDSLDKGLPLGIPDLMMGFTAEGQMDPKLGAARESRLGISMDSRKKARENIPAPAIQPGADAWMQGNVVELDLKATGKK